MVTLYRDASTGEFVTKAYAINNPNTTVSETTEVSDGVESLLESLAGQMQGIARWLKRLLRL